MNTIEEKIEQARGKTYRGRAVGVHVGIRIPPLLMEGVLAYMKENGVKNMSKAIIELLQEGIINAGTK